MNANQHLLHLGRGRVLTLDVARVMGILNITPDSFSDGGAHVGVAAAVTAAERMVRDGADIIDIGGESTRPGAARVPAAEQIRRIDPVIRAVRDRCGESVVLSIDTTLSPVARAAIEAGAGIINDVSGGTEDPDLLRVAAESRCAVVLMHRLRPPDTDVFSHQHPIEPSYPHGVVEDVKRFLALRIRAARDAGIDSRSIVIDPGLGFGKSVAQNLELIDRTAEFATLGYPVLSGLSRKSFTAAYAGLPMELPARERLGPTLELSRRHQLAGAIIFRVHDVREHVAALRSDGPNP